MTTAETAGRRKRRKMEKLTPQQITEAALDLVDREGLDGLTMRALANAMDVQAPVLYRHFSEKRDLMDAMAEAIVGEVQLGELPGRAPLEDLAELIRRLRKAILAHRDAARIIGGSYVAKSNTLRSAEVMMGLLSEAGLSRDTAVWTMTSLLSFVLGETLEQQGLPESSEEAVPPLLAAVAGALSDGAYRHLDVAAIAQSFFDFDGRFEFGLRLLLGGLDSVIRTASRECGQS